LTDDGYFAPLDCLKDDDTPGVQVCMPGQPVAPGGCVAGGGWGICQ
jgi:hypothetical protein